MAGSQEPLGSQGRRQLSETVRFFRTVRHPARSFVSQERSELAAKMVRYMLFTESSRKPQTKKNIEDICFPDYKAFSILFEWP